MTEWTCKTKKHLWSFKLDETGEIPIVVCYFCKIPTDFIHFTA